MELCFKVGEKLEIWYEICKAATFHVFETAQAKYYDMITLAFKKQCLWGVPQKVAFKIFQYSLNNTCAGASFLIKLQARGFSKNIFYFFTVFLPLNNCFWCYVDNTCISAWYCEEGIAWYPLI